MNSGSGSINYDEDDEVTGRRRLSKRSTEEIQLPMQGLKNGSVLSLCRDAEDNLSDPAHMVKINYMFIPEDTIIN